MSKTFHFRHTFLLSAHSSQSHMPHHAVGLMSHHWVNNKCNRVKGWHWRWLIFALRNFLLCSTMFRVFRSNHHCSWKFHKFHRKTPVLESLFFLKMMKLYKGICSAWMRHTSAKIFFSQIDIVTVSKIQ